MKDKTLKDIAIERGERIGLKNYRDCLIDPDIVKKEAIKWIKEDFELVKNVESHKMLERWKNRLNITEEELKSEDKRR